MAPLGPVTNDATILELMCKSLPLTMYCTRCNMADASHSGMPASSSCVSHHDSDAHVCCAAACHVLKPATRCFDSAVETLPVQLRRSRFEGVLVHVRLDLRRWVPGSARIVVLGAHVAGTGAMQVACELIRLSLQ